MEVFPERDGNHKQHNIRPTLVWSEWRSSLKGMETFFWILQDVEPVGSEWRSSLKGMETVVAPNAAGIVFLKSPNGGLP